MRLIFPASEQLPGHCVPAPDRSRRRDRCFDGREIPRRTGALRSWFGPRCSRTGICLFGTCGQRVSRQELFRTVASGNGTCSPPGTSFPSGVAFEVPFAYSGLRAAGGRKDCGSVFCSQTGTGRVFDSSGRVTEGRTRGRLCVRGSSYLIPPPFQIKDFADAVGPGGPSRRPFVCGFPDPAAPPRGARSGTWRGEPSPQGSFPVRSTHHHQKEPA